MYSSDLITRQRGVCSTKIIALSVLPELLFVGSFPKSVFSVALKSWSDDDISLFGPLCQFTITPVFVLFGPISHQVSCKSMFYTIYIARHRTPSLSPQQIHQGDAIIQNRTHGVAVERIVIICESNATTGDLETLAGTYKNRAPRFH
jgi:hypothetical protein